MRAREPCKCLCLYSTAFLSATFFPLCVKHAKRCGCAAMTQFLDCKESLNNVAIDLEVTKRGSQRQTVQQMRQRQIYSYHLITISIIHWHHKELLTRAIRLLGKLTEASPAQISQLLYIMRLVNLTGGFAGSWSSRRTLALKQPLFDETPVTLWIVSGAMG